MFNNQSERDKRVKELEEKVEVLIERIDELYKEKEELKKIIANMQKVNYAPAPQKPEFYFEGWGRRY